MCVNMIKVAITTNGSGAFSKTVAVPSGALVQYRYVPGSSPIDTNGDLSVVGSETGFVYINHANIGTSAFDRIVRRATSDETGATMLYADSGEPVGAPAYVAEPLTVTISSGDDTKSGTLYLWFAE